MQKKMLLMKGLLWECIGTGLMFKGVLLVVTASQMQKGMLMGYPKIGNLWGAFMLLAIGFILGVFKGRKVLRRSVKRTINRLLHKQQLHFWKDLYTWKEGVLILGMIGLGMLIRLSGMPSDIRGVLVFGVGCALVQSGMLFFQYREQKQGYL